MGRVNLIAKHADCSRGFTLVEVLSAVLLLSIGLLAVLTADQASRETQQRAVYISIGRGIAQSKVEKLRAAPIDSLPSFAGSSQDSSLPSGNLIQVAVVGYPNPSCTSLYKCTVTVTWPEGRGTRKVCYETLIARR
jgi:prepilin-type N-terminal cleavage/methylation domain-containing protein